MDTAHGEHLSVPERVIVAPSQGVFQPLDAGTAALGQLAEGQPIGHLHASGRVTAVHSPFAGAFMGLLARPGERVRAGQPLAWLRAFDAAAGASLAH
ncbi:MAG: hypothetical protein ACRD0D_13365 [Acidimicrobiales bacterium]